jgi:hypothetical protein
MGKTTLPRKQFERSPMSVAGLLDGVSTFDEAARTLLASQFFEVWCMCASARKVTAHTHNAQVHAHMLVIVYAGSAHAISCVHTDTHKPVNT